MEFKKRFPLDIQFFAEGDNPGEENNPTDPPAVDPEDSTDNQPETFTSDQIENAKKEAAQQAKLTLYSELGVKSLKDLQDKLKASETKEEADATLKSQNEQLNIEVTKLKTERAFMTEAFKHSPHDIGLLFTAVEPLLQRDPDTGEICNMEAAIEQVKKEKPFLFVSADQSEGGEQEQKTQPQHPQPGGGTPPTQLKGGDLGKSLAERFNKKMKG